MGGHMGWGITFESYLSRKYLKDIDYLIPDRQGYLESLKQQLLVLCTINKAEIEFDKNEYNDIIDYIHRTFNDTMTELISTAIELQKMEEIKEDTNAKDT